MRNIFQSIGLLLGLCKADLPVDNKYKGDLLVPSNESISEYCAKFRNKAKVLKIIHSMKAETNRSWDLWHTLAIVLLGGIITFAGIMGPDKFADVIQPADSHGILESQMQKSGGVHTDSSDISRGKTAFETGVGSDSKSLSVAPSAGADSSDNRNRKKASYDLAFALAAVSLFLASLLNLIFRWKEEHTLHFQAVVKLTKYINWLDECQFLGLQCDDIETLRAIRSRYQGIVENLPPNAEKDYERAKRALSIDPHAGNSTVKR